MKKHVHCRFEEDLLSQVDSAAELLHLTRTGFLKLACREFLGSVRTTRKNLKVNS